MPPLKQSRGRLQTIVLAITLAIACLVASLATKTATPPFGWAKQQVHFCHSLATWQQSSRHDARCSSGCSVTPEFASHPAECDFRYDVAAGLPTIAEVRDDVHASSLRRLFADFESGNTSHIEVYGTMCVSRDCAVVMEGILHIGTPVGVFVLVLARADPQYHALFSAWQRMFPSRLAYVYRPEGGNCAQGWNSIAKIGFAVRPTPRAVWVFNGDIFGNTEAYAYAAAYYRREVRPPGLAAHLIHGWSAFVLYREGWDRAGPFDEFSYPQHGEDVEYSIRVRSLGMRLEGPDASSNFFLNITHKHGTARAASKWFEEMERNFWQEYLFRKWNVSRVAHECNYDESHPVPFPFGIEGIDPRRAVVIIDQQPQHRECVRSASGPFYAVDDRRERYTEPQRRGCALPNASCLHRIDRVLSLAGWSASNPVEEVSYTRLTSTTRFV